MSAELLQRLAEAGTPLALVMEVAEALADARAAERLLQARREKDAARQQEKRDRDRLEHHVTSRDSTDIADVTPESPPLPKPPRTPQTPTPPDINPPHTRARAGNFSCPEGVDPQHWQDFLANRKTKRLTNTPTAYRQQLKALAELTDDEWPPGRIVEFAAARGWGAIHDPRTSFNGQPNSQQRRAEHGTDSLTAIALQRLGSGAPP